jgi:hypothetical protein
MLTSIILIQSLNRTEILLEECRGIVSFRIKIHTHWSLGGPSTKAQKLLFEICYIFLIDLRFLFPI